MKLTVSTTVDEQIGYNESVGAQYSKEFDSENTTIQQLLNWATKIQKARSIHKFGDNYLADIGDIKIGKIE